MTKAEILQFVNTRLRRNETNIDAEIIIVLDDLSDLHVLRGQDETQTLTATDTALAYPTDALLTEEAILAVQLTDSAGVTGRPLTVLGGGYREYLDLSAAGLRSVPRSMIAVPPMIYVHPWPSGTYTAVIDYYRRHPANANSIEFGNQWRTCIKFGVTAQVAAKYGINNYAAFSAWDVQYQREKAKRKRLEP
jgi:hypothetical protein